MIFRFPDKPIEASRQFVADLDESAWLAQEKYDGWRLQIYKHNGQIDLLSRIGKPIDQRINFPSALRKEVEHTMFYLPDNSIVDAEFVGPRGKHNPAVYVIDVLALNGMWLTNFPFIERWNFATNLTLTGNIQLAKTIESNFLDMFDTLKAAWDKEKLDLCEGIVVKRKTGKMSLDNNKNAKSQHMFKIKYRDVHGERF